MKLILIVLAAAVVGSSMPAQSAEPASAGREVEMNWFEALSGGHYFGENETEAVQRLTPNGQRQLLQDPTKHRSVQVEGQIAQLRDRFEPVEPLTKDQEHGLRAIFASEIVDQEAELHQQYRSLRISGQGATWYGARMLASNELGTPGGEQFQTQLEDFSRRQLADVQPILTARQFAVYKEMQQERLKQQQLLFVKD